MTDVHGDFERSKIYKVKMAQHHLDKKEKKQPLPPLGGYSDGEDDRYEQRAESPHSQNGAEIKQKVLYQLQLESAAAQVERLRVLLREREIENSKLKNENSMLKQRERRNQKDLEQLEQETQEAPNLIRRLKEDLAASKVAKVKLYYAQIGDDSRIIRQLHDERNSFKEKISKLEELVQAKQLADRDTLATQLKESSQKVSDLQKLYSESEKKLEMVDRNLTADNRYLRGKIHAMDREKELVLDQIKALEENIKEKEKIIASLSIYRYNAIHRKAEATCKVCSKRERDEKESQKRAEILESLPPVLLSQLEVVSGNKVEFQVELAAHDETKQFVYSQLRLLYSDDPLMLERVQKKKLDAVSLQKASKKQFLVDGLTSGTTYYFSIASGHQDVFATPSAPVEFLVDMLPEAPTIVTTLVLHNPPTIKVVFQAPPTGQGSQLNRFRVYQSQMPDFSEKFLAIDAPSDLVDMESDNYTLHITNPQTAVPYYFKVAACNAKGEGALSEISSETVIDYVPEKPLKPVVKKVSATGIHVSTSDVPGLGSPPSRFKITMVKIVKRPEEDVRTETSFTVPAAVNLQGKKEMHYNIIDVERGATYKFSASASNSTGESEESEWSDEIDIDGMVPALNDLQVAVVSPTSFAVTPPSVTDIKNPVILGYRIQWAHALDMVDVIGATDIIPCDQKQYLVGDLEPGTVPDSAYPGQSIYVNAQLVGEKDEGMPCNAVFVPLASAIDLPASPVPPAAAQEPATSELPPNPGELSKSSSRLSVNERVSNMHYGYAAFHAPPAVPVGTKRTSSTKRSHGSLDNLRKSTTTKPNAAVRPSLGKGRKGSDPNLERGSNLDKGKAFNRSGSLPQISK
ncbi:hypothetical protein HDV03_001309 [Kappamyces sp. JEL0829]|nr:hypothetical protein HDV03_001309 [Kappamyces sp. JEL0829]